MTTMCHHLTRWICRKRGFLAALGFFAVLPGGEAQELYWDINGTVPGPGGTSLNALNGTWSLAATNWNTDDEGGAGMISSWVTGANPRFNARLPGEIGQYQGYTVTLGSSVTIGDYMEYVAAAAGSKLAIVSGAGGPFTINSSSSNLFLVIAPDQTLESSAAFVGTGVLHLPADGNLHLTGAGNSFLGVTVNGGSLQVLNGGSLTQGSSSAGDFLLGESGPGLLRVDGGGTLSTRFTVIGSLASGAGNAVLAGSGSTWTTRAGFVVGFDGKGALVVSNGALLTNQSSATLAFSRGSEGSVTLTGSGTTWSFAPSQFLTVGLRGEGTLRVENGARVIARSMTVGNNNAALPNTNPTAALGGNGIVTITGTGSELTTSGGTLTVGTAGGTGKITVENGGRLLSGGSRLGQVAINGNFTPGLVLKGAGTVTVTGAGSEWAVSSFLRVGNDSEGRLDVLDGGKVTSGATVLGYDAVNADGSRGNGTALVSGINASTLAPSTWQASSLIIADWGNGALTIAEGGVVRVGATGTGNVDIATLGPTTGTLNIGTFSGGSAAGVLQAGTVRFRSGTATINFNQTNATTFSSAITGNGTINQRGTGTTTLTGLSTNGGSVHVTQGTLVVNGQIGSAATTVAANGRLSGTGVLGGPVTVHDGGRLAPGASAGLLTLGALTLNDLSLLDFELGPPQPPGVAGTDSDLLQVNGALVLDGFLNVTPLTGFATGTYRLINHTGPLTNNVLQIGAVPAGFGFVVDTSVTGQVNLLVNSDGLQFWDGTNNTPNGVVDGGSGTWNGTSSNWANPDGTVNSAWLGKVAVFSATPGAVSLGEPVAFQGLQFVTDGYVLSGGELSPDGIAELRTDTGVTSTLSSPITGPGGLQKTGGGRVVLTQSNSFSGGTLINAGTLRTENSAALGLGGVTINDATLAPVGRLDINTLTWNGGSISLVVGDNNGFVNIAGDIAFGPGTQVFDFAAGTGFAANVPYEILAATNLASFDLSFLSGPAVNGLTPIFEQINNSLFVSFFSPLTGAPLQNSAPVNLPITADYVVTGADYTGTPTENNMVNSLSFQPSTSLLVFNNLTVTSGRFEVGTGRGLITGGNILTPGDFAKTGGGSLVAESDFQVAGAAQVRNGRLYVNGRFATAGGLTVFQNALLGGTGVVVGDVVNNGIVAPGNSIGTLSIVGDYTQSPAGTFELEIANLSSFDRLRVTGSANLAGTLQVLNTANNLAYGQQYAFLQAAQINGDFDQILMPDPRRFRGRFLTRGGTGTLLVAPTSYTLVAVTGNQRNVARALDSYIPARGNDRETVSIALDMLTEEQYPAAFDQIAPTFHESVANIAIEQAFAQVQMLNQRMSSVRLGTRAFQTSGIEAEPLVYDKGGKRVADPKDLKTVIEEDEAPKWSLWTQGTGMFAKTTSAHQVPGYRTDGGGVLFGTDYTFGDASLAGDKPALTTGFFGGYQGLYADYDGGGSTTMNSALFGTYVSFTKGGFYADAVVAGGYNNFAVRRPIEFSTIDRTARSSQDSGQFAAALNLGHDWQVGKFTLGPILGAQYTYVGIAPFTETGAESLDLRVTQQNANSLRTTLGGRLAYTWKLNESVALIPEARMFWLHEFLNNPRAIGAALDGGAGPGFNYMTADPYRDSVFCGAGLTAQFGENLTASAYWNIDFGRQDYLGNMVSLNLGWRF